MALEGTEPKTPLQKVLALRDEHFSGTDFVAFVRAQVAAIPQEEEQSSYDIGEYSLSKDALSSLKKFVAKDGITDWALWYALSNKSPNHQARTPDEHRAEFCEGHAAIADFADDRTYLFNSDTMDEDKLSQERRQLDHVVHHYITEYRKSNADFSRHLSDLDSAITEWFRNLSCPSASTSTQEPVETIADLPRTTEANINTLYASNSLAFCSHAIAEYIRSFAQSLVRNAP